MRTRMIVLAAFAAAIAVGTAVAAGGQRYADPRDDSGTAPDITDVSVVSDESGQLTFGVTLANRESLDADDCVAVAVDADRQLTTGDEGIDYVIGIDHATPFVQAWSETRGTWADASARTFRYSWDAGVATFQIDRSELGWTPGFQFWVGAWDGTADGPSDLAPSEYDRWTYSLHLPFALRLVPDRFDLTEKPKAGKSFSLAAHVIREDTGATLHAGTIRCAASLAGKPLKASMKPRFFSITISDGSGDFTQAVCDWKLPKTAKGKTLRASVTVSLAGKSVRRAFTAEVR
jgi:hypothetical protein